MKTLAIALSAAVLSFASVGAHADSEFDKYDVDGDGYISLGESKANPNLMAQFKDLDADQDGQLSQSEFDNFEG
ncbi:MULTISPECIES: calmodulin [Pseudoalteromonas]|jgi:Ca2+-binding EF-hand superfamily protein|uniref:EF-hand domain-containing protein n=1 Tax=Pseudoalteromonas piscicida TaxID=43662 RepID=A0AAD0RKS3_PSEO7|nr:MULTISPECIES: calmodulin [Pseudoalteromonas]ASD69469.1 calmodulin [Pseudoalteromonas piscicida]AXR00076.1 EF-hand domain-containing protein [Pseudoalteromonas piscicida]AXR04171.1 EF-hand domain-containing protein [Pseudoalteromonas piscicida]MCG9761579.1 EF-hand domain-containing protein [Pseudoalteromonas sp. Isolate6]MCO7200512.1 EF-hand domain-containing protein [Pseudoalteromonas sp. OANN1]